VTVELPRFPNPFAPSRIETTLRRIAADVAHVLRHQHELREILVSTKQEILDSVREVNGILVEARKDVGRVIDKLDEAVANGNLDDVAAAVNELRPVAQAIGDAAEKAAPEAPVEPTPAPENPEPVGPGGPQGPNNLNV
jgi:hypothetical protein